jgi:nucleotide-binding universal stress UspA family protein
MSIKDVLALALRLEADEPALRAASMIAGRFSAHATALVLTVHAASVYAPHEAPLSQVLEDLVAGERSAAVVERRRIERWIGQAPRAMEIRDLLIENALQRKEVLTHARAADLSIMTRGHAQHEDHARAELLEALLFGSGRPVLLMPPGWRGERLCDTIMICWDGKREAARAVADAMPFLRDARDVVLTTIDAPSENIAAHLASHGVKVRINAVEAMERTDAEALLDVSLVIGPDMIVMGAYGHSRAEEFLLGGVTRALTRTAPAPLLLSH